MLQIVIALTGFYGFLLVMIGVILWVNTWAPHPFWLMGIGIIVVTIIVTAFDFANKLRQ